MKEKKKKAPAGSKIKWVTQSEFARQLGLSSTEMHRLVKQGVVTVNVIEGKSRVNIRAEKLKCLEIPRLKAKFDRLKTAEAVKKGHVSEEPEPIKVTSGKKKKKITNIVEARFALEKYKAKKMEAEFKLLEGSIVSADDVVNTWKGIASNLKKSLFALPARIGPLLASETNPHACKQLLKKEIIKCLQDTVDAYKPKYTKKKKKKKLKKKVNSEE